MLQGKTLAGINEMFWSRFLRLILMLGALLSVFPGVAIATLGESAQSIEADQRVLGGQLETLGPQQFESQERQQPSSSNSYTVQQISTPAGVTVNEYLSSSGTVFAVSWRGPRPPDLSQLLGQYFAEYQTAAAAPHRQRRHLVVKTQELVVETGGHMRDLRGRAYIPSLLPPDVSTEEIQ
jgi:Protein of unknown function (DUF2844)